MDKQSFKAIQYFENCKFKKRPYSKGIFFKFEISKRYNHKKNHALEQLQGWTRIKLKLVITDGIVQSLIQTASINQMLVVKIFCLLSLIGILRGQTIIWRPGAPNIVIQSMKTDVDIVSNLASTTVQIHFFNPDDRQGEGELVFPLPQGVSVSRYALDIDGRFREAVPVPKDKGTQVFEALENVRVDPGIIQKSDDGNSFKTRVFPIPSRGTRKVRIGYQQELDLNSKDELFYRMVSNYARPIANFTVELTINADSKPVCYDNTAKRILPLSFSNGIYTYSASILNQVPSTSVSISIPSKANASQVITKEDGDQFFYAFVKTNKLPQSIAPKPAQSRIALVWDNSLSCAQRDKAKELSLLESYLRLFNNAQVDIYHLNFDFRKTRTFPSSQIAPIRNYLTNVKYDGGTKFNNLRLPAGYNEVLFFSDGVSSLGPNNKYSILGKPIVHTINSIPTASHDFLNYMALKNSGIYADLTSTSVADALRALSGRAIRFLGVEGEGVDQVYPIVGTPVVKRLFSIAGRADRLPRRVILKFGPSEREVTARIPLNIAVRPSNSIDARKLWAQKAIEGLQYDYDKNKQQINNLGSKYSIVTKGTSLIVLENINDYVRFNIVPPAELKPEFDSIKKQSWSQSEQAKQSGVTALNDYWGDLTKWWKNPKADYVSEGFVGGPRFGGQVVSRPPNFRMAASSFSAGGPLGVGGSSVFGQAGNAIGASGIASAALARPSFKAQDRQQSMAVGQAAGQMAGSESKAQAAPAAQASAPPNEVSLSGSFKPSKSYSWALGKDYMKSISSAIGLANQYETYLKEREKNNNYANPTFYIDVAEFFISKNRTLGLRILSNIADLALEDAALYKSLMYYFKQYEDYQDCLYIAQKINSWRSFEPQSHRDLALAYELVGNIPLAAKELSNTLNTTFYSDVANNVDGFQDTILMDVNRMVLQYGPSSFKGLFDSKYLQPLPVDLRVIMTWNQQNVDLDLHVVDPSGEDCYYGHKHTAAGGRFSKDFTTGLGPEQFLLKTALKGDYQFKSNYFGETKLTQSGPATVNLEIYRNVNGKPLKSYKTVQISTIKSDAPFGRLTIRT